MARAVVLVVDDDASFRFAMRKALTRLGYDVVEAPSGEAALIELAKPSPPDVALLDLWMDGIDGLEVLRRRGRSPTRMLVLTGHGSVTAAVEAMKLGAFSFLEKPVDADVLAPLLAQAVSDVHRALGAPVALDVPPLVGASHAMDDVRAFVARVGPTDETVAIYGETGVGKEVVARHLHLASARSAGPFVALNVACVPRELFESELFGHKRGSFTGATSDRAGLFREASSGTLFIDELGELPLESQAKLLRALETKRIRPVGESREIEVDVRIVAATNRDLWTEVRAGRFREDLYFRLQVFPVVVPPLRARRDDIAGLAAHLLERVGPSLRLSPEATSVLSMHDWPGNVRELLNVLRRAALFAEGGIIDAALARRMVAASIFAQVPVDALGSSATAPRSPEQFLAPRVTEGGERASVSSLADVERAHIEQVLGQMGGNVTRAAVALGIDRRTLQRKLRGYGIAADDG